MIDREGLAALFEGLKKLLNVGMERLEASHVAGFLNSENREEDVRTQIGKAVFRERACFHSNHSLMDQSSSFNPAKRFGLGMRMAMFRDLQIASQ